ncbi:hypothetical protein [Nocardioides daphniae]|uniref:DUF308 domain-containing protein n=1 Tax=Nocardioides daphniae TaxID=402297 RepID=A0A4P7UBB4_9ACTN|nr:hypothetical protein [Nocardioides daphniae]QCC76994.1 hypothetical protein E2C04_06760 [Nocardioides daphniae]GGD18424.1 hypothetical protein GCM10007231_16930 [Nocardioides daphniae]
MTTPDEDEAWRLIVDNYAETANREVDLPPLKASGTDDTAPKQDAPEQDLAEQDVPEQDVPAEESDEADGTTPEPVEQRDDVPRPGPFLGPVHDEAPSLPAWLDTPAEEERFVPPTPPPAPPMPWRRRAAWIGVFAAPVVFVLAAMTGVYLPRAFIGFLVVGLVAGFGYLVLTMPKEPPDPWDDGSRV